MNALDVQSIAIDGFTTVPTLFWHRVTTKAAKIAMREKDRGIWKAYTWGDYGARAKAIGMGLIALGLEPGDRAAILSDNNKEWLFCDLGVLCAAGVSTGIYPTDSPAQVEYLVNDSDTKFLFVEDEEQLDKILAVRARTPGLKKIIVFDMEGLRDLKDPQVMPLNELAELGEAYAREHPALWDERIALPKPGDVAIIVYTSGTTGPSKGALLTHRNIIFQGGAFTRVHPELALLETDEALNFLPLCHVAERIGGCYNHISAMHVVNFAEAPDTVPQNLREVAPHLLIAVPRVWEKLYSGVTIALREGTLLGRLAYRMAIDLGMKASAYELANKPVPAHLRVARAVGDWLALKNIRVVLGLDRIRYAVTGAAPISPDLIRWYWALGVRMYEVYGQTENAGLATSNYPGHVKIGSIGLAAPGTEVMVSPDGEILLRGPHVFAGYLNKPDKTAETVRDGWLHTGDVGVIDEDGFVHITDRMKDIIITAGGKNVTPSEIENQLKFSPYISDAIVIGDKRNYLTCLVMIDHDNVVKFAQDHDVPFTNYASLCRAPEVVELISKEVEAVNKKFARVETIKRFKLIDQLLTAEDEELTPTMKLKRSLVEKKYRDLIDGMYSTAA
ncbi:MAG TPA: long-chain fatty acid--CoA ligase [Hyphomicrobiaceae bacterium]|jgi:long-chain acyl-CoA synthetase|nr:long-chain fatty acid--CoA ligase [Hyphomicrobiaceae bacterium]